MWSEALRGPAKPADPDINVRANQVWARIALAPKSQPGDGAATPKGTGGPAGEGESQTEVREARLRGEVVFHQDPSPGKQRGTNVSGEAVDVMNLGENRMYFKVFHVDPHKVLPLDKSTNKLENALLARMQELGKTMPLAKVDTDEFTVEGPKTTFVGYEKTDVLTAISALHDRGDGTFEAKLHESPFYAAGGGQVSDQGVLIHEESGAEAAAHLAERGR